MDMYTRVKRVRRQVKRDMYGMPLPEEVQTEEDASTEPEVVSAVSRQCPKTQSAMLILYPLRQR